ncbi:uncharacterized protein LOC119338792 [Triticum dicoccoides]|uniref:uncharacterized protein LOC119338792 n=1 Tax=Triticum dicoccoides TaxID=85692 RepID=UPI0018912017|nr:uncharacterized protein LOC119338792 [Triticum dicoccoides]
MLTKTLVPIGDPRSSKSLKLVGCVEGTDTILAITDLGSFAIDPKSLKLRKLSDKICKNEFGLDRVFENLFLYTSFNNPPAVAGVVGEASSSEVGGADAEV